MLISCPECDAGYEVPDALLRNARMMRCAACGHDWMTEPLDPDAKPAPAANGARPSPSPTAPAAPPPPRAPGGPVTQQISCPNCDAVYDIPAVMLTSPRSMRCATCGHDWVTTPIGGQPTAPTATPSPAPSPPPPPVAAPAAAAAAGPATTEPATAESARAVRTATTPEADAGAKAPLAEPLLAEPPLAEPPLADADAAPGVLAATERDELEAMRAAQATTQEADRPVHVAELPLSLQDRVRASLRANRIACIGWAATIAILYVAARGAVDHREALVQLWPPGQRIFNWLGIG